MLTFEVLAKTEDLKLANEIVAYLADKNFDDFQKNLENRSAGNLVGIPKVVFQARTLLELVSIGKPQLLVHNIHIESRYEEIFHQISFDKLALFTRSRFVKGKLVDFQFNSDAVSILGSFNQHVVTSELSLNDDLSVQIQRKAAKAGSLYEFSKEVMKNMYTNIDGSVSSLLKPYDIINLVELERKYHVGPIERRYYQIEAVDELNKKFLLYSCILDFYTSVNEKVYINKITCDGVFSD